MKLLVSSTPQQKISDASRSNPTCHGISFFHIIFFLILDPSTISSIHFILSASCPPTILEDTLYIAEISEIDYKGNTQARNQDFIEGNENQMK